MSTEVRWRKGTTAQHAAFTGALAEITVDTDKKTVVVHDGVTPGGFPIENGNFIASGTGAVTRTVQSKLRDIVHVKDFGAVGDGVVDDTLAIQRAIDSLPNSGGTVYFHAGRFKVTSTINIGNGTNTAISTKIGVKLVGAGAAPYGGGLMGTTLLWSGVSGGTVVSVNGTGEAYGIDRINIDCNNLAATGLAIYSVRVSSFTNFSIQKFTGTGMLLDIRTGPSSTVLYASGNIFQNWYITTEVTTAAKGIYMKGHLPSNSDWHRNSFIGGQSQLPRASSGTSYAAHLAFTDSNTWLECDLNVYGTGTGFGVLFDSAEANLYPQNNFFYGCSVISTQVNEPSTNKISDNFFYGHTTKDGESIPTNAALRGITDAGTLFGAFNFSSVVRSANSRNVADSANVTLETLNGNSRWRLLNNANNSGAFGFNIEESTDGVTWVKRFSIDASGQFHLVIPGIGERVLMFGATNSGGTGFRQVLIDN